MNKLIFVLLGIILAMYLSACTQIEDFVNIMTSDSTKVKTSDKKVLEKNKQGSIDEWELYGEAEIDDEKSADEEKGSVKLSKTAKDWSGTDKVISNYKIPVFPGKTYEIKYKLMTESWPPPTVHVMGEFHNSVRRIENSEGSYASSSSIDKWEDNSLFIKIPDNPEIQYIIPRISMLPKYGIDSDVWIDNINVVEVESSSRVFKKNKKEFNGSLTRLDALGNIEIFRKGKWTPFFLFGIYADKKRVDWTKYSEQGFNTNMWASDAGAVRRSKNSGLYSNIQLNQYIVEVDWLRLTNSEKISHLEKIINNIKKNNLMNDVIFYYIDNEFYDISEQLVNVCNVINEFDLDDNGKRMHPIYMLNGAFGLARKYNDIVDITGTYVAFDRTNKPTVDNFTGLQISENQKLPAVIAQVNRGVGLNFRPVLFGAIAKGAKGLGFWRDGGSGIDIEKALWWEDFPNMVKEINQMLPLIREPHYTEWTANCNNDQLIFGTRMFKNRGHLIISNPTSSIVQANFTITELPYKFTLVKDYFNDSIAGDVNGNIITVSLLPHDSKVIWFDE